MRHELNFDFAPPARPNGGLRGMAARLACRLASVDVSAAQSNPQSQGFASGTVINFGAGSVSAPNENTVSPNDSATAATGGAASGGAASGGVASGSPATSSPATASGLPTWLPWAIAGGLGLLLIGLVLVEIARKK